MAGYSKITLIGNLGRDPETRYTPSGRMNVQFTLAVNRPRRDQSGQPIEQPPTWYRVTAWGNLAETLVKLAEQGALTKGKQVFVEGRFEPREYQDQNGQTRTSLDVNAVEFQLLGSRTDAGGDFGGGFGNQAGGFGGQAGGGAGGRVPARGGDADDFGGPGGDIDEVPF